MQIYTYTDGSKFYSNNQTGDYVIFNHYSWRAIIIGTMIKFKNKDWLEATKILENSFLLANEINNLEDCVFYSHESEYHWAMILTHGPMYWEKGHSEIPPKEFNDWMVDYTHKNQLSDSIFEFSSN